jgi:hypothetical protein
VSATITLNPTLVDGRAGREGAAESFATIISSNGNANDSANANIVMRLQSAVNPSEWQACRRGFLSFDPTDETLPDGAIITAAVLSISVTSPGTNSFTQSICVTKGTLANTSGIAAADYQGTKAGGQTEWASRVTVASMSAGVRSTWTLNAAGLAALETAFAGGSPYVLSLYFSGDLDATSPTWGSSLTDDVSLASNDTASPSARPQLIVTYRIGPGHAVASLTGTLANTGDTVNCSLFNIEVFV